MEIIAGFGLGGSTIALFARVGGGIFTKAADVGADLVGKVEKGIPEDDPRNPAVIADNVGDNVGDVAGMGADLFGSCAESTCAAMVISAVVFAGNVDALLYPILISAEGIPISLLTMLFVKVKTEDDVSPALMKLLIISSALMAVAMFFVTRSFVPADFEIRGEAYTSMGIYWCFLSGLVAGLVVGLLTGYYTSGSFKPVQEVAKSCETGAATNIIYGLALGYKSTVLPYIAIAIAIFVSWDLGGMYGVAIGSLGMLGTLAIALTIDAYGPVSDNAGGIAEMAGLPKEVRRRTDILDAAGNTTAAIGKGFAIGAAIMTSLALFAAFLTSADALMREENPGYDLLASINLLDPVVFVSLFMGAVLPFLFTAMTMKSVGKAAFDMIEEVRRQFREIPGLMEGTGKPDYAQCVAISTQAALREMIPPGLLIMGSPLVVGFLFGVPAVAGMLAGSLVTGGVLAIASSNSGGAWDNAKKYIEAGNLGGKGSEVHKAAVVGDTEGYLRPVAEHSHQTVRDSVTGVCTILRAVRWNSDWRLSFVAAKKRLRMQPFFCLAIDDCESKTGVALKMVHKPLCRFIRQPCAWLFPVHQCTADTLIDLKRLSVLDDQSTNGGVQRAIRNLSQLPVIVHAVRLVFAATQKIEVWQFLLSPAIRGDQQIQAKSRIAASGYINM
jgi:K(+)-stimulated pyrophosphate-energized sodium pump